MKLYVAGGSDERLTTVRDILAALAQHGIAVTYDWTKDPCYDNPELPADVRADVRGVFDAEVAWIVVPAAKSEGAFFEAGVAFTLGRRLIVSGPHASRCPFMTLATEVYSEHRQAMNRILSLHRSATDGGEGAASVEGGEIDAAKD